jgi:hypothetical protein
MHRPRLFDTTSARQQRFWFTDRLAFATHRKGFKRLNFGWTLN